MHRRRNIFSKEQFRRLNVNFFNIGDLRKLFSYFEVG